MARDQGDTLEEDAPRAKRADKSAGVARKSALRLRSGERALWKDPLGEQRSGRREREVDGGDIVLIVMIDDPLQRIGHTGIVTGVVIIKDPERDDLRAWSDTWMRRVA